MSKETETTDAGGPRAAAGSTAQGRDDGHWKIGDGVEDQSGTVGTVVGTDETVYVTVDWGLHTTRVNGYHLDPAP